MHARRVALACFATCTMAATVTTVIATAAPAMPPSPLPLLRRLHRRQRRHPNHLLLRFLRRRAPSPLCRARLPRPHCALPPPPRCAGPDTDGGACRGGKHGHRQYGMHVVCCLMYVNIYLIMVEIEVRFAGVGRVPLSFLFFFPTRPEGHLSWIGSNPS